MPTQAEETAFRVHRSLQDADVLRWGIMDITCGCGE